MGMMFYEPLFHDKDDICCSLWLLPQRSRLSWFTPSTRKPGRPLKQEPKKARKSMDNALATDAPPT
jgi:hypothetical protein